ncbi:hypothetical protein DVV91_17110 [Clostridium botulinum]|uniref:hypothetical protein n=1 Tax=Clostridium botulinum TaxID=1491 RepID=UPI001967440C|nr:hypothetical protein [Clostridium botulinum]MBN1076043.1 hypothetical protein [Clostridium botulinum]
MEELEDKIENNIRNKVFIGCFSRQNFDEGKAILYKYYLKYYTILNRFETQRLILYNLIVAERMTTNNNTAMCNYVIQLKKDMDNIENYKYEFTGEYCKMLSYYCDCNLDITKNEKLKYYNFCLKYYRKAYEITQDIDSFINLKIIEFSISIVENNFNKVLNIIEDLHILRHVKSEATIKQMLNDLGKINIILYKDVMKNLKYNFEISI